MTVSSKITKCYSIFKYNIILKKMNFLFSNKYLNAGKILTKNYDF
jgi:hypothetical protein